MTLTPVFNLDGRSSQEVTPKASAAEPFSFTSGQACDSFSFSCDVAVSSETHSQFCAGVSNGIVRPFPLSVAHDFSFDISQSLSHLNLAPSPAQSKPLSAAERQSEINRCAQAIADIVHESQSAMAKAAAPIQLTTRPLIDEHKSEAVEEKRGSRLSKVKSKASQKVSHEASSLTKFIEKVVTRVTQDPSRTQSLEKTFTRLLDNDAAMLKCCQKMVALNLLPKERFVAIDHVARELSDTLRKSHLVQAVRESGKYDEENVELCLQYASTLTIMKLIESSPDLQSLSKDVKLRAPTWLQIKTAELD